MPREITTHHFNSCNRGLAITAVDEPGDGGANHYYEIRHIDEHGPSHGFVHGLYFQNGPILERGVNGLTHEALLAVLIDRLQGFQAGPFACL